MTNIKTISVFCGSSVGNKEKYFDEAYTMGKFLAEADINIIYGGAKVGLMGAIADGALKSGGTVTGVIPDFLRHKEIAHEDLSELIIVKSMHERKMVMFEKSDGAIVLPGGFGTLDEMFELLTWGPLGLHKKPVGILNILGYYDQLISFITHTVNEGLLRKTNRDMLLISENQEKLIQLMSNYVAPRKAKWINKDQI
jgi:uncharacterized protein (TIGR00730 family)